MSCGASITSTSSDDGALAVGNRGFVHAYRYACASWGRGELNLFEPTLTRPTAARRLLTPSACRWLVNLSYRLTYRDEAAEVCLSPPVLTAVLPTALRPAEADQRAAR